MELNIHIDSIVLYGVERVDRDQVAAQIAQRLEFRLLTEGLAQRRDHPSRGASIGERVADAIWNKLRSGGQWQ